MLLYLLLRGVLAAQAANAISLLLTVVANTAVNRRVTFGIRGRRHAARHQADDPEDGLLTACLAGCPDRAPGQAPAVSRP